MRRVLLIAYYFPPIGGAGVQNTLKLVRYLPEFGYEPIVVTGPGEASGRWTPKDDSLTAEISELAEVVRISEAEPSPGAWGARSKRWLRTSTAWDKWWTRGVVAAVQEGNCADVVLASMSPYETARPANRLAKRLGVPWVAALRDPWALDEMLVFPSAFHRWLERREMDSVLRKANRVVMNTPQAAKELSRRWSVGAPPIHVITNGFDSADFAGPGPSARTESRFRIAHTGYLHTSTRRGSGDESGWRRALGGAVEGVDISTRSHRVLLDAVNRILEDDPALLADIEVLFAGNLTPEDLEVIRECPAARAVGYLSHGESVELIRSADLLFLPMQNLPPGSRSTIVPGKTYEYLASGTRILGAVPNGDARDLLIESGNAVLCRPDDSESMREALLAEIAAWREHRNTAGVSEDFLRRYDRRELAGQMADVLDRAVAGGDAGLPSQ
jgi:glycosyltransferase involved in cell wall biosynthesis